MSFSRESFNALLPLIVADVVGRIATQESISEQKAAKIFYNSKLYSFLEREETKVWHYSSETLCRLFEEEKQTGKLIFPEM